MTLEKCMPARASTSDTDSDGDAIKFQYYSALFKIRYVLCFHAYRPAYIDLTTTFGESGIPPGRGRNTMIRVKT